MRRLKAKVRRQPCRMCLFSVQPDAVLCDSSRLCLFYVHHGAVLCDSSVILNSSIPGPEEVGELDMGDGSVDGGRGLSRFDYWGRG